MMLYGLYEIPDIDVWLISEDTFNDGVPRIKNTIRRWLSEQNISWSCDRTCKKSDLEGRNVLFMDDGGPSYLKKMFDR